MLPILQWGRYFCKGTGTDRDLLPVAFESKRLNRAERNYSARDREQLALVHATHKWRHYLLGQPVTVRTDHRPLFYPSQTRIHEVAPSPVGGATQPVQPHAHLRGRPTQHLYPDALSRRPDHKADPPANQPVLAVVSSIGPDPKFLTSVCTATTTDSFAQMVISRMILADTTFADYSLDAGLLVLRRSPVHSTRTPHFATQVLQHSSRL